MVLSLPSLKPIVKQVLQKHAYSVEIINPSRNTAYSVRKFRVSADFETPDAVNQQLCYAFHEQISE